MATRPASAVAKPTIGILCAGEMGATLGGILVSQGYRVVTAADDRSARTRHRAESAGLELLNSVAALAQVAHVVLSVVPPNAAIDVAARYCSQATPVANRLFIDLNAIAPATSERVDEICRRHGVRCVDGAIHGMAAKLPASGTMYLSGPSAQEAADLFGPSMRVKVLSGPIGRASAFKMLISGMAKGTVALFVEMALAARQAELLDELLACYGEAYPGIMALVERLLPTYPQHSSRRGAELQEVEETMRTLGLEPRMVAAAQRITAAMGNAEWHGRADTHDASAWPAAAVIEALFADTAGRLAWQVGD
jgi:3-hydroxyisobutyrate dehydrogenase-like beta-hydroxyacid dehydrogenase